MKFHINDLWKEQNLIDISVPSYLTVNVRIENQSTFNNKIELDRKLTDGTALAIDPPHLIFKPKDGFLESLSKNDINEVSIESQSGSKNTVSRLISLLMILEKFTRLSSL